LNVSKIIFILSITHIRLNGYVVLTGFAVYTTSVTIVDGRCTGEATQLLVVT